MSVLNICKLLRKIGTVPVLMATIAAVGASVLTSHAAIIDEKQISSVDVLAKSFQLNAVRLEGVTVYKAGDLAPLYAHYLTRDVTTADLVLIAAAITEKYRADGYFLSQAVVPPQTPGSGVALIRVYEGYVSSVDVTGPGAPAVNRHLAGLAGQKPLRLSELERRVSLASAEPGVTSKPRLEPVIDDPSQHRLVVDSQLTRFSLSAYADNRGPRTAGPWQSYLNGAVNSLFRAGDRLGLSVLTAPRHPRDFTYGEMNYSTPLGEGRRLRGYIGISKSHDGADPFSQATGGESWSAAVGYDRPLKRSRTANVTASLTANVRHVEQDWNDAGGYNDDLGVVRASVNADLGAPSRATNLFAQASVGRRDAEKIGSGRGLSRFDAHRDFWKVNAHASHYRDLGEHAGLYLSADAQWSPDALLASEELAIGGAPYGRGYNYAEITGDRGVAATAELRAGWDPKVEAITFVQGYGFLDVGKVWNAGPAGRSAALASAGVGLRVRLGERATIGLEAARPLTRTPYDRSDKDWRPFVTLSARF